MHIHVVGAGLAGLSAAVALSEAGQTVTLVEAAPFAGGRCRSYFDRELGLRVDNGNHLLLSGNRAAFAYIDTIGARPMFAMPAKPMFPFMDVESGLRWWLRPNLGRIPWWVLSRKRRAPGTRPTDHLVLLRVSRITSDATIAGSLRNDLFFRRLVAPLGIAALNTPTDTALARLLGAVVRETFLQGGRSCIPALPREGLSESLIDPAVAWLDARGSKLLTGRRVVALRNKADRVVALETTDGPIPVEAVVLAVPPWVAGELLAGPTYPTEFQAILNIHFRVEADPGPAGFIGLVGGMAEWVFVKRGHVSVTISAANRLVEQDAEAIAGAVWPDVRAALELRRRDATVAGGEGAPRHRCRHRRAGETAAGTAHGARQPRARRRLDRHRVAGDDRRCHQVRPNRGRTAACRVSMGLCRAKHCHATPLTTARLAAAVTRAAAALAGRQQADGHWLFELEADATIPAEYVLLEHFLDRIEPALEAKIGVYLRSIQGAHGGWPLFHDGAFDLSASVKAYFALKAIGDDPDAPHMTRARRAILAAGGAERTNVFTRAQLALFGQVPWRAVPVMPLEIMHLPLWFPFHLSKVSYWSRTVIVPLLVLMALRPVARNPRDIAIQELFRVPPADVRDWIRGPYRSAWWGRFFKGVDAVLRVVQPAFPRRGRQRAIDKAVRFVTERLNGDDGLGGIYPAIANSVMMFDTLGYPPEHPDAAIAWRAVRKLLVVEPDRAYCQPCLSPIWDTGLAGHAMAEAGVDIDAACVWLRERQILDVVGDWAVRRPGPAPRRLGFPVRQPALPGCR